MGILPLQFLAGESPRSLGLTGEETVSVRALEASLASGFAGGREIDVVATRVDGTEKTFRATVRIDTEGEIQYYQHGGILQFVLRQRCG